MLFAFAAGSTTAANSPAGAERPNLILLLTDDQRWDTLGVAGNPVIETPHLDRLAAEGLLFRNAFVTTPICAVSRASILSGQYAHRHGIRDFTATFSPQALAETYPLLLRAGGYTIGFIGKWGIGARDQENLDAVRQHFDFWAGFSHQGNYWHDRSCRWVNSNSLNASADDVCDCPADIQGRAGPLIRVGCKDIADPIHLTTRIIPDKVADFLDSRRRGRPFALSVSFKAPHALWDDVDHFLTARYEGADMPLAETVTAEAASAMPEFLLRSRITTLGEHPDRLEISVRDYYRLITGVDAAVGRIRQALAARRLEHNTVILFTSDNGFLLGEHGLFGKSLMYEESIRVPMILYDPRLAAGRRGGTRDQMALNIDVAPTLLELAGLSVPEGMQGRSLVPLFTSPGLELRDSCFFEHHFKPPGRRHIEPSEGVRTRRLKYIRYFEQEPPYEQLYDLLVDPGETRNLVRHPNYQVALAELRERHRRFYDRSEHGHKLGQGGSSR